MLSLLLFVITTYAAKWHLGICSPSLHPQSNTIEKRFNTPEGFQRISIHENSFAHFLRNLRLKPEGSKVLLYNGRIKQNNGVYLAVADLRIGNKDLHQCADAVIRLRAEYLYSQKQFAKISFHFTNGFPADYSKWMQGYRILVSGNTCIWVKRANPSNTYETFWEYLETVFSYAGTLSLAKDLKAENWEKMEIGDVLVKGGSPGHAVIVVDMAVNPKTGEKVYMLAQSYMPAQEIQVLSNPNKPDQPWYSLSKNETIETPEWTFSSENLKKFID